MRYFCHSELTGCLTDLFMWHLLKKLFWVSDLFMWHLLKMSIFFSSLLAPPEPRSWIRCLTSLLILVLVSLIYLFCTFPFLLNKELSSMWILKRCKAISTPADLSGMLRYGLYRKWVPFHFQCVFLLCCWTLLDVWLMLGGSGWHLVWWIYIHMLALWVHPVSMVGTEFLMLLALSSSDV